MTRFTRATILVAVLAAAGEVWMDLTLTDAAPTAPVLLLVAFLAGPLLFLALLAWRRRTHAARSRFFFWATVVLAVVGLAFLGNDLYRHHTNPPATRSIQYNPVLLPLIEWFAVVAVWGWLVVIEAREKRERAKVS